MSEEVLIPKMKRLDSKQKQIKIPVNNFILVILCTLLIICATFVNIDIKHYVIPQGFSFGKHYNTEDFVYCFSIIPQIPVLLFTCSVLGRKLSVTSACLFLILGLFAYPVFGLGGGFEYIGEYSFGYILAFVPAVYATGSFLFKKYSFLNMIMGAITGVLIIHLCGILYMMLIALIKSNGGIFIKTWIHSQSGLKIIYDIILSFIGILIGKYIHDFLKFLAD